LITPGKTIDKTFRLEGNICRRVIAPGLPPPAEAHPTPEKEKKAKVVKKARVAKRAMVAKKRRR
jgi:hypothetical protein